MRSIQLSAVLCALVFAGVLSAGLVDKHFPEKTEKQIAEEFEAGLGAFLEARLKESVKPRIHVESGKEQLWLEVTKVEGEDSLWQELARFGWYDETLRYAYKPFGRTFKYETADIPPREIASWFVAKHRTPEEIIALAVWLAEQDELRLANAALADLATVKEDLRPDIEAWLAGKYSWELPKDGLTAVATQDLDRYQEIVLFLTGEALEEYREEIEEKAEEEFERLEDMQGGDVKGKPGYRRKSPTLRLDQLQDRIERYKAAFGETEFFNKKRTQKDLGKLEEAVKADIEYIETEKFKAERLGIEGDWLAAAKAYDRLWFTDPWNPNVVEVTAQAWSKAAGISDAGRKSEDPGAAKKAALLYERMCEIFESALAFHNHAGVNWLAAGDKKKAIAHHELVIERTEGRTDLTENEKKNREYAEAQLKLIK
jgi:hypothetical protein